MDNRDCNTCIWHTADGCVSWDCDYISRDEAVKAVKAMRWIPCGERLPEEEKNVLVTRKFLGVKDVSHGWNEHIPQSIYVEIAHRLDDEWFAYSDEYKIARSRHTDPIAWMPLPEPYHEEQEGSK